MMYMHSSHWLALYFISQKQESQVWKQNYNWRTSRK